MTQVTAEDLWKFNKKHFPPNQVEQTELENVIDKQRPDGWLGVYNRKDNVWMGKDRYKVTLSLDELELDLNNPLDFIKHRILLANVEDISPTYDKRLDRKYLFYMEAKSNIERTQSAKVDREIELMSFVASIKDDKDKMRNFLLACHRGKRGRLAKNLSADACRRELYEFKETRPDAMLDLLRDEDLKYKIYYYRALESGAFLLEDYVLTLGFDNGRVIGETIEDGIKYIRELANNPEKDADFAKFQERIKR